MREGSAASKERSRRRREGAGAIAVVADDEPVSMEGLVDNLLDQFPAVKALLPRSAVGALVGYIGQAAESVLSSLVATETPLPDWLAALTFVLVKKLYRLWAALMGGTAEIDDQMVADRAVGLIKIVASFLSTVVSKADRRLIGRVKQKLARQLGRAVGESVQGLFEGLSLAAELRLKDWMKLDAVKRAETIGKMVEETEGFLAGIWGIVLQPVQLIAGLFGKTLPESLTKFTRGDGKGTTTTEVKVERGKFMDIYSFLRKSEADATLSVQVPLVHAALSAFNGADPKGFSILMDSTTFGLCDPQRVWDACMMPDAGSVESGRFQADGSSVMVTVRRRALDLLAAEMDPLVTAQRRKLAGAGSLPAAPAATPAAAAPGSPAAAAAAPALHPVAALLGAMPLKHDGKDITIPTGIVGDFLAGIKEEAIEINAKAHEARQIAVAQSAYEKELMGGFFKPFMNIRWIAWLVNWLVNWVKGWWPKGSTPPSASP